MNGLWSSVWNDYSAPAPSPAPAPSQAQQQQQQQQPQAAAPQPLPLPPPAPRPPLAVPPPLPPSAPPTPPLPPLAPLSLEQWAAVLAALAPPSGGAHARAVPAFEAGMFKTGDLRALLALHGCAPPKAATKTVGLRVKKGGAEGGARHPRVGASGSEKRRKRHTRSPLTSPCLPPSFSPNRRRWR